MVEMRVSEPRKHRRKSAVPDKSIVASHPSTCGRCEKDILKGHLIQIKLDGAGQHVDCDNTPVLAHECKPCMGFGVDPVAGKCRHCQGVGWVE